MAVPIKYLRRTVFWLCFIGFMLTGVTWLVFQPRRVVDDNYSRSDWINVRYVLNSDEPGADSI